MNTKTIIYVVENKNWVQFKRTNFLLKYQKSFKFKIVLARNFYWLWRLGFFRKKKIIFSTWRIVHSLLKIKPNIFKESDYKNFLGSVTSHSNIGGGLDPYNPIPGREPEEAIDLATKLLRKFAVITVNSLILYNLLKNKIPNLMYCPNGVDTSLYYKFDDKIYNPKNITIGWVGKKRGPKNFELVNKISNSMKAFPYINLKIISIDKNFKYIPYNQNEMLKFYNKIDFYLCVSLNEGTPNPALEAGACGIPIISTKVGNMPEIIVDKNNGFFIKPSENSIMKLIKELKKMSKNDYDKMSLSIEKTIKEKWSWQNKIEYFTKAYHFLYNIN